MVSMTRMGRRPYEVNEFALVIGATCGLDKACPLRQCRPATSQRLYPRGGGAEMGLVNVTPPTRSRLPRARPPHPPTPRATRNDRQNK